ncbi:MAG: hypothetical protein K8T89_12980 [Planctomycetes bacterium]|nr:hypothetical protein [Planctomycetota bacterium]
MMVAVEYLVNHGASASLGRFANSTGLPFVHGDSVVVRSGRGVEAATILAEATTRFGKLIGDSVSGTILRALSSQDEQRFREQSSRAHEFLADAQSTVDSMGLALSILDVEILLDGEQAILHAIPFAEDDLTPLLDDLSHRHGIHFTLCDMRRLPTSAVEPEGCGKPGCGSEKGGCTSCSTSGGGCSTGSCSKGSADAKELTVHFSELRRRMEER